MASRSQQARALGRALSTRAQARVELTYDSGAAWIIGWPDGPTVSQLRELTAEALASGDYPDMVDRLLSYSRRRSTQAYAAQAAAAHRTGELAAAIQGNVARRREIHAAMRSGTHLPAENSVALDYLEQRIDNIPHPDRPVEPDDGPVIDRLLAAAGNSEYRLVAVLLHQSDVTRELPPGVTSLSDRRRAAIRPDPHPR